MKHVYFCRHGLSQLNVDGKWAGSIETPLTDIGRKQAKEAGLQAKNLHIDQIFSSPLARAYDTAKIIALEIGLPETSITMTDLLKERHFGVLEGKPYKPRQNLDDFDGVETIASLIERAQKLLEQLRTTDTINILLVGHGAIGRAVRHALHPDIPVYPSKAFDNAKIVKLL